MNYVLFPFIKKANIDMAVFDSLRFLSTYIKEAHISGKQHCADLYEIVQYAGNIVPRLYLMITVGRYIPRCLLLTLVSTCPFPMLLFVKL